MAERRMFTQKIVDSDAFLDMPLSAQSLYFHLNMRADDDGFLNNPRKVQRMIGASDDDLKLLLAKRFVLGFENGVIVIKHWRMHNLIRKDRYNPTQYVEQRELLLLKDNGAYTEKASEPLGNQLATTWQPDDNQLATQDRIGQDRTVKDSLGEGRIDDIAELYSQLCPSLPKLVLLSEEQKSKTNHLVNTYGIEKLEELFKKAENTDYLKGKNDSGWKASFDWLINEQNMMKVLNGFYDKWEKEPAKKGRYDFDALERMSRDKINSVYVKGNPELEKKAEELKKMLQETY